MESPRAIVVQGLETLALGGNATNQMYKSFQSFGLP